MKYTLTSLILLNAILLLLSLFSIKRNNKVKVFVLVVQVVIISFFYGLRDIYVGADTDVYVSTYLNQSAWIDIGMRIINKLIFFVLNSNWKAYLVIINIITSINMAISYWIIFKNNKKYVNLGYWALFSMPYIILMQVNIIRQGLALSFVILGLLLINKSQKNTGWILVIFGCAIHYSMLPLVIGSLFFYKFKINAHTTIFFSILFLLMSLTGATKEVIDIFPDGYLKTRFFGFMAIDSGVGFLIKYLFYFISYIYMTLFISKLKDPTYYIFHKFMGFLILAASFLYSSEVVATRFLLSADFIIPIIYLFPHKIFKEKKSYISFFVVLISLYYFYVISSSAFKISFLF